MPTLNAFDIGGGKNVGYMLFNEDIATAEYWLTSTMELFQSIHYAIQFQASTTRSSATTAMASGRPVRWWTTSNTSLAIRKKPGLQWHCTFWGAAFAPPQHRPARPI
ncbi:hypothetical protein [Variovorax sp. DT-64]|uniref:hypothetical protein n=1 Tax=Variovorax sp. DT-64 TaxID=3396160 RepID=UPI003F5403FB